jgi:hypothetical protein
MDDLKVYAQTPRQLKYILDIITTFSNDINMKLEVYKCKIMEIVKGKHKERQEYQLKKEGTITNMSENQTYKYLGIGQNARITHKEIKDRVTKEYKERLNKILKTSINNRNMIKAINTCAVQVLTYTFGTIQWNDMELEQLNRLTREALTKAGAHHPRSAVERLYLPRQKGGRGLIDIKNLCKKQIQNLRSYFFTKQTESSLHKAIIKNDKKHIPLDLGQEDKDIQIVTNEDRENTWKHKQIHGFHYSSLHQEETDVTESCKWLTKGEMFTESEGHIMTIQGRFLPTRNYRKYITNENTVTDDKCNKCESRREITEHILSECRALAAKEYVNRHNNVAKVLHHKLAMKRGLIETNTPYYKYTPLTILENERYKLYRDRTIITDRTVSNNRPDITLIDKIKKKLSN